MKTRRIIFSAPGAVDFREGELADIGPEQVLVKTSCSLISTGTELTCLRGRFAPDGHWARWARYPFAPGYSNVGLVIETGPGVSRLQPGTRVVSHSPHASHAFVDARDCTPIPDGVSDEEAAWFALAAIAQIGIERANIKVGATVAILGAGVLGQMTISSARLKGATEIIAVARTSARLRAATEQGATRVFAAEPPEAVERLRDATGGRMADVVIDVTGDFSVLPQALRMTRDFGRVVLLGDTGYPEKLHLTSDVLIRGVEVVGSHFNHAPLEPIPGGPVSHREMADRFFSLLREGKIRVRDLVTHRFRPEQAEEAYSTLSRSDAGAIGAIFEWARE